MSDRVVLSVPARGEFAKAVRMTAASLVSRMGMSYDDVDDVRIAAEEAFVYACARTQDTASVDIVFTLDDDLCVMEVGPVVHETAVTEEEEQLGRYAMFILQSVCDDYEIIEGDDGIRIRMTKQHVRGGAAGA